MFVRSFASTIEGIRAVTVTVEVNISAGIGMYLVGLPDNAVKESQERIRAAFENSGLKMSGKKVVVNLAPADLRKEGSAFDLPIALGILAATGQCSGDLLDKYMIMGELSLDGSIKPVKGVLPIAIKSLEDGFRGFILPQDNAEEAAVIEGLDVIGVDNLAQVVKFLNGDLKIEPAQAKAISEHEATAGRFDDDFSDVKGQRMAKRAMEIAAAGGHNMIMIGSPGSGKTMLAKRMPTIMPSMTLAEALETTKIHSVAGKLGTHSGIMYRRPFRSPHNISSPVALIGGGTNPQPGEISLAHNGVLFLDEIPEFGRNMLEILRQPLEDKVINVSRAKYSVQYPANFILIASMNPCPCGYYGSEQKECSCSVAGVIKYRNRISGPLLDRIDLHINVPSIDFSVMSSDVAEESSDAVRERVVAAREVQQKRLEGTGLHTNAMMNSKMVKEYANLSPKCTVMMRNAMDSLNLSARAYTRVLKVARTIADLSGSEQIEPVHLSEAIQFRTLDRSNMGV